MNLHRISILFALLTLISFALVLPGCDKLITEVNNIILVDTTLGKECKACHTDKNDQLIVIPRSQWANSAHADPSLLEFPIMLNGQLKTATACGAACHSGDAYVDSVLTGHPSDTTHPSAINCYTCHLPHSVPTDASALDSLRGVSLAVTLADGESKYIQGKSNMCANCHKATGATPTSTDSTDITLAANFGPHYSAQADVLNGTAGFRFNTSVTLTNDHKAKLTNGCIDCHFGKGRGYDLGEHTFRLQYHDAARDTTPYVANCSGGTCHSTGPVSNFYAVSSNSQSVPRGDSVKRYADTLRYLLSKSHILNPDDTAGTMYTVGDILPPDAAKILYNYLLYRHDRSRGLHNLLLMNNLLQYSVEKWGSIPPRADFTISDNDVCVGDQITFTNKSRFNYDSSTWYLVDSVATTTANSPTYSYSQPGIYSPRLKVVSNPLSTSSQAVKANAITVHGPLTAQIDADTTIVCLNSPVTFSDISSGISNSRQWYINGDTAHITTGLTASFTPAQWGPTNVRVVLRAFNNCTPGGDTVFQDFVIVADSTPVANFGWNPLIVRTGVPIQFVDSSLGPARSWDWTFNLGQPDSSKSTQQNPTHTFTTVGTWQVRLTVENDCGKRAVTKSISVSSIAPSPVEVTPRSELKK